MAKRGILKEEDFRIIGDMIDTRVKKQLDGALDIRFEEARKQLDETLDNRFGEFAIMVGNGFADVQRQFSEILEDMVTKGEFNSFKNDMSFFKDQTERSFHALQTDMTDVKSRLTNLEIIVEPIPAMVEEHKHWLRDHEGRILKLERIYT